MNHPGQPGHKRSPVLNREAKPDGFCLTQGHMVIKPWGHTPNQIFLKHHPSPLGF